jgi:UPF0755 protein
MLLALLSLPACTFVAEQLGAPADATDATEVVFEVPRGATPGRLGPLLEDADVIDDAGAFGNYVRITDEGGCLKAGRFHLSRSMSAGEILETLCGVPLANDEPFTVVEGWRIREIDAALTERGWIQPGEYTALARTPDQFTAPYPLPEQSLEGYLYPETYMVSPDRFTAEAFIQRQLDTLAEVFYTPNEAAVTESPREFSELIIMASMLEREEPTPSNRPLVAGILWKRLDSRWNLGVDATSRYTLAEWNNRSAFIEKLFDPEDPYNTRLKGGLPPTAIGNPGKVALNAALDPVDSEYWYYLHDSAQVIHPSRNVAEHNAFKRQYNVH